MRPCTSILDHRLNAILGARSRRRSLLGSSHNASNKNAVSDTDDDWPSNSSHTCPSHSPALVLPSPATLSRTADRTYPRILSDAIFSSLPPYALEARASVHAP